jgi:hypothetical protein
MAFFVRRYNTIEYFIGYSSFIQPLTGPPQWAMRFASAKEAYDQFPSVLHWTMEVVGEAARAADIEQFRFQNVDVPEPFAPGHLAAPPF